MSQRYAAAAVSAPGNGRYDGNGVEEAECDARSSSSRRGSITLLKRKRAIIHKKVLIVDSHRLFCMLLLVALLSSFIEMTVTATATIRSRERVTSPRFIRPFQGSFPRTTVMISHSITNSPPVIARFG